MNIVSDTLHQIPAFPHMLTCCGQAQAQQLCITYLTLLTHEANMLKMLGSHVGLFTLLLSNIILNIVVHIVYFSISLV